MKKSFILTSVLALAACGGGSGGGAGTPGNIVTPETNRSAFFSNDVLSSNAELTDMYSQILVANDGVSPTITRSATTTHEGKSYTQYDLSDVVLNTAAFADNFNTVNQMATLTFNVENGEIKGIHVEEPEAWGENGINLARDENNELSGSGRFYDEFDVSISEAEYKSIAKANNDGDVLERDSLGLKYSDFGILSARMQFEENGNPVDDNADLYFAGGYNINDKKIDMANYNQDAEFTGRAIGEVHLGDDAEDGSLGLYTNNASLTFDGTKTNLSMPFYIMDENGNVTSDRWYTVNATINPSFNANNPNANIASLTFTGGNSIDSEYAAYKFSGADTYTAKQNTLASEGSPVIRDGFVSYYGDNGNPSEAVGTMRYVEEHSNIIDNRIGFESTFGAKRD